MDTSFNGLDGFDLLQGFGGDDPTTGSEGAVSGDKGTAGSDDGETAGKDTDFADSRGGDAYPSAPRRDVTRRTASGASRRSRALTGGSAPSRSGSLPMPYHARATALPLR